MKKGVEKQTLQHFTLYKHGSRGPGGHLQICSNPPTVLARVEKQETVICTLSVLLGED